MFWRMLKKDLADKKGLNVILLLFMCFASILTVASAILLYANTFGIRITEDKVNAADLFIVSERDLDGTEERQESIIEWFNNRDDIVDVELGQTIVFNPNAVDFENVNEDDYSTIVNGCYYAFDLSAEHDKVTDMDGNFFDLPYGTIAVPQYIRSLADLEIGDKVYISSQMGNIYEFTIGAFTKDPVLNGYFRLFFNDEDYQTLLNDSPIVRDVYYADLTEGAANVDIIAVASDFNGMKDQFGDVIMYSSLREFNQNEDSTIAMNAIMMIVSLFLIIMVFMTVTFTIKTAIKNEEKELGMLKALGVESVSFNWLFAAKYLALSLIGTVVGFIGGIHIAGLYIKYMAFAQLKPETPAMITVAATASVMIFLLIILFVSTALRRMKKISIMDVIAGENRGERFKALPGFFLHKIRNISLPFYLALTDIITKIKRYSFLIIAYVIGISLCIVMYEANNTTNTAYWMENYWQRPHFDFALDLPDDVMEKYINRGGSVKGAYDIINAEIEEAGIPAHIRYFQYAVEDPRATHDGITYDCLIRFNIPEGYNHNLYEGVWPELPNEVEVDAYHAHINGISIGDTVSIEYNKYNEDGISYDHVTEDFIVTGMHDSAEAYMTFVMSPSFEGVANSRVAQCGGSIDASEEDIPMYIEQLREMYGHAGVRDRQEEVRYQLNGNNAMFTYLIHIIIPILVLMMALVTVLYLSVNILDEVPEIALLKCTGFGTGSIKAWQILRILIIFVISALLALLNVRTVMYAALRVIYFYLGNLMAFRTDTNVLNYYILFPLTLIAVITAVTAIVMKKVNSVELWRIRND